MNCHYKPVERAGLYIMVFFTLLNSCTTNTQLQSTPICEVQKPAIDAAKEGKK